MPEYMTAREAADTLDVTKNTLYAYVSRGLIRSEPTNESRRTRRYRAADVRRLKRKTTLHGDPSTAARTALDWGLPVVESELTLIEDDSFYYRGRDACELAQTDTLEEVAAHLWDRPSNRVHLPSIDPPTVRRPASTGSPLDRLQSLLPRLAAQDERAYDLSPDGLARTGTRILSLFADLLSDPDGRTDDVSIAKHLRKTWTVDRPDAHSLLNAALVLCADHGLNVTAFTVRCVASAEATPYGAVNAGLSALRGRRHTGNTARIAALFREAGTPTALRTTITKRLRRGDRVPGFGHRLYPGGDPRAALLMNGLVDVAPDAAGTAFAKQAQSVGPELLDRAPGLDFALVSLARALHLPEDAPLILFALGRIVGWTGHMIEQYDREQVIRPRAQYVGPPPSAA